MTKEKKEFVISPELSIPVRIIHGAYPGKTLTVTAGVHGNEYVGILFCWRQNCYAKIVV